jgi:uncharacterized protein DUF2188
MSRKTYHVTPINDAWRVKLAGAKRADSVHAKKSAALSRAKALAKAAKLGQVKVHGKNGEIQTEYTYGADPREFVG